MRDHVVLCGSDVVIAQDPDRRLERATTPGGRRAQPRSSATRACLVLASREGLAAAYVTGR